jgi:hypothetical protein
MAPSRQAVAPFGALLLPSLAVSVLFVVAYWAHTLEDAMISFRYALRIAEHYPFGYWNRVGPAVEGYTSTLWVCVLSLAGDRVDAITTLSKVCGVLAFLGIPTTLLLLARTRIPLVSLDPDAFRRSCSLAAIATLLYVPLIWYATVGMETTLFTLLVTLVFLAPIATSNTAVLTALNVLAITTRPDGALFVLGSAAAFLILDVNNRRHRSIILVTSLAALAAIFAWRVHYFGYPMPNTYYAKASGAGLMHVPAGLHYVGTWLLSHPYMVIPPLLLLFATRFGRKHPVSPFILALMATLCIYGLLIIKVGGDDYAAFPFWRHALQITPLLFFLTFYSLCLLNSPRWVEAGILCCALLWPLLGLIPHAQSVTLRTQAIAGLNRDRLFANQPFNPFFLWLRSLTDRNTTVVTSLAGELPLAVDAIHIDALGLNDEYIAHHGTFDPNGAIDSKSDFAYVMSKKPDIIEGYVSALAILHRRPYVELARTRPKMITEMFTNDVFRSEYVFVTNAPYGLFDRAIFLRRDFYESSVRRGATLEMMTVRKMLSPERCQGCPS